MNRLTNLILAIFLAMPALSLAQTQKMGPTILAKGHAIAGAYVVGVTGELAILQDGPVLFCMIWDKIPKIVARVVLPEETYLWDYVSPKAGMKAMGEIVVQVKGAVAAATIKSDGSVTKFNRLSAGGGLFRGRLSMPATRRRFAWRVVDDTYWVVPTLTGLRCFQRKKNGDVVDCGSESARLTSEQSLGHGLGYRLKARVTVPFFDLAVGDAGHPYLLFRQNRFYARRELPVGKGKIWGKAPDTDNNEVVKFEHRIPPLCVDFDDDGQRDLIHVDPGTGTTLIYRSGKRALGKGSEPDSVFRVTGHVLWRWLADGDGDGRKDLFLLELSKLNVIAQVKVMQKRSLPVILSMRRQLDDGRFQRSARWSDRFEFPCEISMTRNVRRVRFRAPFKLLQEGNQKLLLLGPAKEGGVACYERVEKHWVPMASYPELLMARGFHFKPFDDQRWLANSGARPSVMLLMKNPQSADDCVMTLKIPEKK